jgi:hypothetical protein
MHEQDTENISLVESKYYRNSIPLMERGKYSPRSRYWMKISSIGMIGLGLVLVMLKIFNIFPSGNYEGFFNGFVTFGLLLISQGLNLFFHGTMGYEYVRIDDEGIEIKNSYFSKIKRFKWEQISGIDIHLLTIVLNLKDNRKEKIELSWATYKSVQTIKERIYKFAKSNDVPMA